MNEAPKKIWVYPHNMESSDNDWVSTEPVLDGDVPYIRADLVDALVEALEIIAGGWVCVDEAGLTARAALKALESAEIGRGME